MKQEIISRVSAKWRSKCPRNFLLPRWRLPTSISITSQQKQSSLNYFWDHFTTRERPPARLLLMLQEYCPFGGDPSVVKIHLVDLLWLKFIDAFWLNMFSLNSIIILFATFDQCDSRTTPWFLLLFVYRNELLPLQWRRTRRCDIEAVGLADRCGFTACVTVGNACGFVKLDVQCWFLIVQCTEALRPDAC